MDRVALVNSNPPMIAVFFKKLSNCGMAAVPDASPKGCTVSVTAKRKGFHSFYTHGTPITFEATFIFSVD